MSADRELLALAAKAAGLPPEGMNGGEGGPMSKGGLVWSGEGECIDWNPLTDDGDALRLAVKIGMVVDARYTDPISQKFNEVTYWKNVKYSQRMPFDDLALDPMAATRRAIVRAAAEIGRAMS